MGWLTLIMLVTEYSVAFIPFRVCWWRNIPFLWTVNVCLLTTRQHVYLCLRKLAMMSPGTNHIVARNFCGLLTINLLCKWLVCHARTLNWGFPENLFRRESVVSNMAARRRANAANAGPSRDDIPGVSVENRDIYTGKYLWTMIVMKNF